ncbi:HTH-type transcriptional activator IlvY [Photobacterium sp. WH77]|uniref:HTH-type transcriptional activator IlvY n=1 Tax=Photobacterium arenosum TaxID=2774143 RepID=A0ABR9BPA0_9GAMM|nr:MULTISPECIES: HTH-type transcriptional activator IlvY [Photobacterium]MBD8513412.1 HTH-type transcriptional activator IlvY [Photobacterium arenosum]MBV7262329.1 HTH-type transcriptional activator IlvY [Photobacterium sp. WH24]MCG2839171.1 HTH-type transcriptional activator IlvY [Photobacterium sp. WH77]MCG2846788.1 HTH-type transcriptional activator IlvY [Photobacterium sp. WH80]MDO6583712.1 HTH-type transcriptional activator IlvY [Photobacterium sp. 2_MG-2023]
MNIKSLQLFLHLCNSKNFSQTAQKMHISPSALSRLIQRLEQELSQPLFIRDNRSVELTTSGRKLLPVASRIVAEWQQLQQELTEQDQMLKGKLTLFCSVTASYSHLPNVLNQFRQHYPQVEIQLVTGDPAQAVNKVLHDEADFAITALPANLPNKLTFIYLGNVSMSLISPLITSPGLQALLSPDIQWDKLPFILPEYGTARENADKWMKSQKIKPNIYAQVAGHEAIVSMVALGCGIGIAPDIVIENSPIRDQIQKLPAAAVEPLTLGLCCKQSRQQEPLFQALLTLFK